MGIPDWVLGLLLIFLIIAVGVVMCQPFFPILHRMTLDRVCDEYLNLMIRNISVEGIGLSDEQLTALNTELSTHGFTVESINASRNVTWGDDIYLDVVVTREYKELQGNLTYKSKILTMKYKEKSKALGV